MNTETRFISSKGEKGGAIYIADQGICINTDSEFWDNSASIHGGALYGTDNIKVVLVLDT